MRQQRGAQQAVVGRIGQQGAVQNRVVGHGGAGAQPELGVGRAGGGVQQIDRVHHAVFDGWQLLAAPACGQLVGLGLAQRSFGLQAFGWRHGRHLPLVAETAGLGCVERGHHGEDGAALLLRHHAPGGKAAAITHPLDQVVDGLVVVARQQKIRVQGVDGRGGCAARGHQGLAQHLAAKHAAGADVFAGTPEMVGAQGFQLQQGDEPGDGGGGNMRFGHGGRGYYKR